ARRWHLVARATRPSRSRAPSRGYAAARPRSPGPAPAPGTQLPRPVPTRSPYPRIRGEPAEGVGTGLVATPIRSDCHRVSSSSGTPAPVTAEIATTGAPAWVRIAG